MKENRLYTYLILLTIPLLLLIYFLIYQFLYYNSKNFFLEDKVAKSIHLKYIASKIDNLDYIFIGSSKTQNHISTNLLKKGNIKIYNYGIPGMRLQDSSFPINEAIKYKPKYIVLSFNISEIIGSKKVIQKIKFPTKFDYFFINTISNNSNLEFKSIQDRLVNEVKLKDLIFQYREYKKYKDLVDLRLKYYGLNRNNIDCNISHFRKKGKRTVFLCQNGDGVILSKGFKSISLAAKKWNTLEIDNIYFKLLNQLIHFIESKNIIPIIIFQPRGYGIDYQYDNNFFQNIETKNIFDLTNLYNKDLNLWADKYHFNYLGREKYTSMLLDLLNKYPNKKE